MDWQPRADATTAVFIFFPTGGGEGVGWGRGTGGVTFQGGSPATCLGWPLLTLLPKHH